ncbi:glycosyl transferase family 2 [Cyanobacterium stanieri PCC 7202]|uniref:Glycosyl transferase family 2 n=1 Tax=Cyanobacterium stanieri (strain ATCC 29140 / PCC 7202) TaxID=292563 RepID=K9YP90_CYASC|nr:glycosyl transferase family 2 [Cyanobacterium stanieri PCC 7202]
MITRYLSQIKSSKLFRIFKIQFSKYFIRKKFFTNDEGLSQYNFYLPYENNKKGVSAFIRMKNEEQKIYYCLKSIIDVFDEIIVIDNQSSDHSLKIVTDFKQEYDINNKIKIFNYPFRVARCGDENESTPENSIHSRAYYDNYALSQCSFKFAFRWDADMILNKNFRSDFKTFLQWVNQKELKVWKVKGTTVYRNLKGEYFLANSHTYGERRLYPCSYLNRYFKGKKSKNQYSSTLKTSLHSDLYPEVAFFELKFADEDEFSHWSITDFKKLGRKRKTKEWETLNLIKTGNVSGNDNLIFLPSTFLIDQTT